MNPILDMATNKQAKLVGLFVLAMVLFNFPLLGVFTRASFIYGIPSVFVYLFIVWLVIIGVMYRSVESPILKDKKDKNDIK